MDISLTTKIRSVHTTNTVVPVHVFNTLFNDFHIKNNDLDLPTNKNVPRITYKAEFST